MKMTAKRGGVVLLLALLVAPAGVARAQAEPEAKKQKEIGRWYPKVEAGLNLSQSSYSDNWAGGDLSSFIWTAILNASAENRLSPRLDWSNTLKLSYGQTHQQEETDDGKREWRRPDKSTDLIDLESILRFTLGGFIDPYVSARFESQFQDASDPFGRTLALNPLRLEESVGLSRKFLDEEDRDLLIRVGFSLRETSRLLYREPVAPDMVPDPLSESTRRESTLDGGLKWVTDYKSNILSGRVSWTSKLTFFQPLFYSAGDRFDELTAAELEGLDVSPDVKDFTTTIDVDWENILTTQITKLLSVNLYLRWVYDKYDNSVPPVLDDAGGLSNPVDVSTAIRKKGQFKQTLAIGITYRFL
jgi:hypothetical protein